MPPTEGPAGGPRAAVSAARGALAAVGEGLGAAADRSAADLRGGGHDRGALGSPELSGSRADVEGGSER